MYVPGPTVVSERSPLSLGEGELDEDEEEEEEEDVSAAFARR